MQTLKLQGSNWMSKKAMKIAKHVADMQECK
jgi:hypothetical protein